MNMRDDWTVHMDESVSGIFYTAEETIRNVKDNFNIRRFYSSEGKDIEINGITERCLVQLPGNPLRDLNDYRKIHCPVGADVKRGYYVNYEGTVWIIDTNVADVDGAYLSARMSRCNHLLRWQDTDGKIIEKWAYNSDQTKYSNGETGKDELIVGDNQYAMLLPIDSETRLLKRGMRFAIDLEDSEAPDIYRLSNRKVNLSNEIHFNRGGTMLITLSLDFFDPNADRRITLDSGRRVWICNYKETLSAGPPQSGNTGSMTDRKVSISGNPALRNGYSRTYTLLFSDTHDNIIPWENINFSWNIISDFNVKQSCHENYITVSVNDENLIGSYFLIEVIADGIPVKNYRVHITE